MGGTLRDVGVVAAVPGPGGPGGSPSPSPTTTAPTTPTTSPTAPTTIVGPPEPSGPTAPVTTTTVAGRDVPTAAPPIDRPLPFTGFEVLAVLVTALVLIAIGAGLASVARHRNHLRGLT